MTTLNARANQAYHEAVKQAGDDYILIDGPSFEEGWETGYKTAVEEIAAKLETEAVEDRDEIAHYAYLYAARIARGEES